MNDIPKVALLVETSRGFGRQLLRGIVRYGRLNGPWSFFITPGDFKQVVPRMQEWGGNGIIARLETPKIAQAILDTGLPTIVIDLSAKQLQSDHPLSRFSELSSDSFGAAKMAAEHLIERGFRRFAYVGIGGRIWSDRREEGFCTTVAEKGFSTHVYRPPRLQRDRKWAQEQKSMSEWLKELPKPIGLMACNDDRGREVLEACRVAGIHVPEEIAVVGVDNDELLCQLADPPLSSVALNAEGAGYRAAALLDRMMHQRWRKPRKLLAEPLHVIVRRSSDVVSIEDPLVAEALSFIHSHASEPLQVNDIVRYCDVSRRKLEIRFQEHVGRTLRDELQRVRLERSTQFLAETGLSVAKIAESVGFASPSYFIQVFIKSYGLTPAQYRRRLMHEE